jgi:pyruvate,water dikinase
LLAYADLATFTRAKRGSAERMGSRFFNGLLRMTSAPPRLRVIARDSRRPMTTLLATPVLPLESACAAALVGGKASGLFRLLQLRVAVPPGVVITADATASFSDEAIPDDAWGTIADAWRGLGADTVIVRSSAIGEDSSDSSFAGQLDSIGDITTERELRDAILRCWRSRSSDRVRTYERSRGHALNGIAIIIQQQIRAALAGVLFTEDPTGRPGALIEYCAGAGEDLVAGRVNPGRLVVDRAGVICRLAEIPDATLTDEAARTLASEGRRIADAFAAPQDIEWTIDHAGAVWFVQARPITVRTPGPTRRRTILWSNANVNENFPDPISPLLYSIAAPGYYHYFLNLGRAFGLSRRRLAAIEQPLGHIIGVHGARMYYNLTSIHTVLRAAPFGEALASAFNQFVGAGEVAPDERRDRGWRGWRATEALELARIGVSVAWQYAFLTRRLVAFEQTVDGYARSTEPSVLRRLTRAELLDRLRAFTTIRCHRWTNASLADASSMVCYGALKAFLRRALPAEDQEALHNTLLKALPGLVSSMPAIELWTLSRAIRADRDLRSLFSASAPDRVLDELGRNPAFSTFTRAFDAYLDGWGFRCSSELMLTAPSFQEDASALVSILRSYAGHDGESPAELLARQQAERVGETRRVLRLVGWPRALALRVLLRWTKTSIQLRERARLKQALLYSRLRRVALAVGEDLSGEGRVDRREDVFMLSMDELDALLSGRAMFPDVRPLIETRRRAHARLGAIRAPDTFTLAEGAYLDHTDAEPVTDPARRAVLTGTSVCGGRTTARATVLSDLTEAHRLRPGDILVTRQTDPGWGPVFPLISGLVIERGGMLSHGAILAREFGIPSLVGVSDATRVIPSGAMVCLDGDRGSVRIIKAKDPACSSGD